MLSKIPTKWYQNICLRLYFEKDVNHEHQNNSHRIQIQIMIINKLFLIWHQKWKCEEVEEILHIYDCPCFIKRKIIQWVKLWCMDQSCAILVGEKIIGKQKIELHHHLQQLQHKMKKINGRKFIITLKM